MLQLSYICNIVLSTNIANIYINNSSATIEKLRSDNNKLKEEVMVENKFSI